MTTNTRIYKVFDKRAPGGPLIAMVRATHPLTAIGAVARETMGAAVATQQDLIQAFRLGVPLPVDGDGELDGAGRQAKILEARPESQNEETLPA